MRYFLKNAGILLVLAGVLTLVIPFFTGLQTNASLATGGALIVTGFVAYIIINKYIH
jgi:uncharacterized membrane protein HdeD (DUF308 family)